MAGRDEMNFAEFPIAALAERAPEGVTELVFRDGIREQASGQAVAREVRISASQRYGLPTVKDEEVVLALLALTKQKNNFTDQTVSFSRYELIRLLGWSVDGRSYTRLEDSLRRWTSVLLDYRNAWWDNDRRAWVDVTFHVIDTVTVTKPVDGGRDRTYAIEWNRVAFRSFESNYLKQINLTFYQSLDSAVAKRLYRYLDKHFYHRHLLEYDLADLAFEHVGLSRDYEPWKVKQKLQPAIAELEGKGYLEPLPADRRFKPAGRGKWRVLFQRRAKDAGPKALAEAPAPPPPLAAELVARGVSPSTAARLVRKHDPKYLAARVEVFDVLKAAGRAKSPGLLHSIIEQADWNFDHLETPSKKRQKAEDATRARKLAAERDAQRQAAEQARYAAERAPVVAYLAALTPAERAEVEAKALAAAEPWTRERAASGSSLAAAVKQHLVDKYVRTLIV